MLRIRQSFLALPLVFALTACGGTAATPSVSAPTTPAATAASTTDLTAIKSYLTSKADELNTASATLQQASDRYYALAQAANFDYAALWQNQQAEVKQVIGDGRAAWQKASPLYEQMEGIVAGVPTLADYDVILDAGASGAEGGDNVVPFDLTLADGRVLAKPGNLFGVTESTLWGTDDTYVAPGVVADFDGNGTRDLGDALPDAAVLKGGVDMLHAEVGKLKVAAAGWQPSEADAFTALVTMVPTMNEYFDSWKNSRFVAGAASEQRDFVAISRLADIQDILSSLQVVHTGVSPLIQQTDAAQDQQIEQGLSDLKAFVADVHTKERAGQRFTAEDADLLGAEAQNRATAITGQITQVAAELGIEIEQ